jgi:methyltransferase
MVTTAHGYLLLLALVGLERLHELVVSRRNARAAFAQGGVEVGRPHFRVMAAMHTLFLLACGVEVVVLARPFPLLLGSFSLAVVVLAQLLRRWAMVSLGERWNTRVIVVPEATPVTSGPYRFLRHPNYVAVVLEIAFLPLVHGAWLTALVFTVANAALLVVRIRVEEAALGPKWESSFATLPRFVPGGRRD